MPKAVRFERYGDVDELRVVEVPAPVAGPGRVLVRVVAAGINPGEVSIRTGALHHLWPAAFPSGQGSDLAGVVVEVGEGVTGFAPGDEVYGFTDDRGSHAELVAAEAGNLAHKPAGVPFEVAGSLFVAGTTAYAAVRAAGVAPGELVVVAGAAGGVGTIAVQLAVAAGATVIGLAGEGNHEWLAAHGVIPVAYGDGVEERITAAAGDRKAGAFIDLFGSGYVDLAVRLGVPPDRIDTVADREGAARVGARTEGSMAAAEIGVVAGLVAEIEAGRLEVPIAAVYPLDRVRDAFRDLERRHSRGKIVLRP